MTKSQSEHIAQWNLERQGYESYLPKFLSGKGKDARVKILFPRYIFVKIELQWHSINGTRGISRLMLGNELKPSRIPDRVINDLKAREDQKGFIVLPENAKFEIGQKVRVAKGPIEGYIGICQGMRDNERVRILINMLGREVPVELDEKDLAAVAIVPTENILNVEAK